MKILLILTTVGAACAFADVPDQDIPIKVDVTVVNVLCTVRNANGLVRDIAKDGFRLYEDGRPANIRYFARQADLPLTVALLLDVSGSMMNFIEAEKHTARKFLEQVMRPGDTAAILGFGATVAEWQDFTSSADQLKKGLNKIKDVEGPPVFPHARPGSTLLHDAIHVASQRLEGKPGAKTVVLISDGLDNGSYLTVSKAIQRAQAVEAVVHSICYIEPKQPKDGCPVLKRISEATGGLYFRVKKKTSIEDVFSAIRDEIRSAYLIGFAPASPGKFGFHKLSIQTTPRMNVLARKGYFIPKPVTRAQVRRPTESAPQ
jgi:VWFA-related protein